MISLGMVLLLALAPKEPVMGEALFAEAVRAYQSGAYDHAQQRFATLWDREQTPELAYNLGCCAFKKKQWGEAIYYFSLAKMAQWQDEDTEHNLQLALNARGDLSMDGLDGEMDEWLFWWAHRIPMGLFFWTAMVLCGAGGLTGLMTRFSDSQSVWGMVSGLLFIASALVGGLLSYQHHLRLTQQRGVILSSSAVVTSGPSTKEDQLLELPAGVRFSVLQTVEGWLRIKLKNGQNGWIQAGDAGLIEPLAFGPMGNSEQKVSAPKEPS
jgi:hypothetical protein